MYRVIIPSRPIAKARARFSKVVQRVPYTPKQTVTHEAWVRLKVVEAVGTPRVRGPVWVSIEFVMPIPASWPRHRRLAAVEGRAYPTGKPDVDNVTKTVCDALNGIAWADDAAIVSMDLVKVYGPETQTVLAWGPVLSRADLGRGRVSFGADLL